MKGSKTLIPLVLFALAFTGSLVAFKRPGPSAAVPAGPPRMVNVSAAAEKTDAPPTVQAAAPTVPAAPAPPIPEAIAASDGPPEVAPSPDEGSLPRLRESLRLAASDEDADVAARAQEAYDSLLEREDP